MLQGIATAVGKLRADDDMFALLEALAKLNPIAIEKADVAWHQRRNR